MSKAEPPSTSASRNKRHIIIGVSIAVLAIGSGLTAYFVTKNNTITSPGSEATATPTGNPTTPSPSQRKKLFGYWGQAAVSNGVGPLGMGTRPAPPASQEQKMLRVYCDTGLYDSINLAFLYSFGGGDGSWGIDFGYVGPGNPQGNGFFGRYSVGAGGVVSADTNQTLFAEIGRDITYCQGKGVKVVMAIGGDQSSPYKWSTGDGKRYANLWYNSFLNGTTDATAPRPFGKAVLDGLQLDIETTGQGWIQEMVDFMVTIKKLSPGSIYSIVPECQSGQVKDQDLNTGPVIQDPSVHLDYIIIQYYNNPTCSYPFGFNYATWKTYFKGPIALGLASDESSAITGGFLNPGQLQAVLDMVSSDSQFYGISLYDVSSGSAPFSNYSSTVRSALDGKRVGSGYPAQGARTSQSDWRSACGGQWNYVNQTCGVYPPCNPDNSCSDTNQLCFHFLSKC